MHLEILDGANFKKMFIGGASLLSSKKNEINDLNVFPVPDGDTGTNMILTIRSAVQELDKIEDKSISDLAKSISMGSLMGARGNSGVILSQLFRGFAKGIEGKKELKGIDFAKALQEGVNSAYNAVLKPVEGTMLTVAKESAKAALKAAQKNNNIIFVLESIVRQSLDTVNKTPSMLPVLKQAGVVDAGGKGIYYLYKGFLNVLTNPEFNLTAYEETETEEATLSAKSKNFGEIEFAYCTEFILKGKELSANELKDNLMVLGDSLLVVGEENLLKVHIHTNQPGKVLGICTELGMLSQIKIDNMKEQHEDTRWSEKPTENNGVVFKSVEKSSIGVITVAAGEGFKDLLLSMGVDAVIEGGQTMNPSTEDFLSEIKKLPSDKIILLPNNKNIIMAAEQASKLSEKGVKVVPSKTVPQGIAALLNLNKVELSLEENASKMKNALSSVKTGQITLAVRDSNYNGYKIVKGDYLGIFDGEIKVVKSSLEETVISLLAEMVEDYDEIITFYYGNDITKESAEKIVNETQKKYNDKDIEIYNGGQPLYHFVISIE